MKKLILLLSCLLVYIGTSFAQQSYDTKCLTHLNARCLGSAFETAVGSVKNNDLLNMMDVSYGWAKRLYEQGYAYVLAGYCKPVVADKTPAVTPIEPERDNSILGRNSAIIKKLKSLNLSWLIIPIILLNIGLLILQYSFEQCKEEDALKIINIVSGCIFVLSICEILMGLSDQVVDAFFSGPWYSDIFGFIIYGALCFNQARAFLFYTCAHSNRFPIIGLGIIPVTFVVAVLSTPLGYSQDWATWVFGIGVLIQTGLLVWNMTKHANIWIGILIGVNFALFAWATMGFLAYFMAILILILIVAGLLGAIGDEKYTPRASLPKQKVKYHPYTDQRLIDVGGGTYEDPDGNVWDPSNWHHPINEK